MMYGGVEIYGHIFLSSVIDVSGRHHAPAVLISGKGYPVLIGYEARWAPETVWTLRER
jgi:hypothetical protein